uniref:Uncharacterized protein n=1 Tax=Romanomermis culicivorax TaxID=13658 RepID=A0A915HRE0_ROMCU
MLFSIVCSILATLFYVENTAAGEVTLLDSSQFAELNWKTYSLDDDPHEHGARVCPQFILTSVLPNVEKYFRDSWLDKNLKKSLRIEKQAKVDVSSSSQRLLFTQVFLRLK